MNYVFLYHNEIIHLIICIYIYTILKCATCITNNEAKKERGKLNVRKMYVKFILRLLECGDALTVSEVLATKNLIPSIFKYLIHDEASTLSYMLGRLQSNFLRNQHISRLVKLNLFNVPTLESLVKIYEMPSAAPYVHTFLLCLTSNEEKTIFDGLLTLTNPSAAKDASLRLMAILMALSPISDLKQQELLLAILGRFKSLVKLYLIKFQCVFDPRPSLKWLTNASLIQKILHIGLPDVNSVTSIDFFSCKKHEESDRRDEVEIEEIIEWVLPSTITKLFLSKGLQHANKLVVYTTLGVLISLIRRFQNVVALLEKESIEATPTTSASYFSNKLIKLRASFLGKLPTLQSLIAMIAKYCSTTDSSELQEKDKMLYGLVLDALLDYYIAFPEVSKGD